MASLKEKLAAKKKLGSKKDSGGLRDKFKKRDKNILEKTYNEREEKSKMGGSGKPLFNMEILEELGIEEFKPESGDNFFEILPVSYDSDVPYFFELQAHMYVGFAGDAFLCMTRMKGKPCYRCEQQAKMYKTIPKGTKPTQEIKDLYPSDRCLYLIWDRTKELGENKDPEYKLKLWAAPKSKIHSEIQSKVRDKKTKETLDISDVTEEGEGRTVTFEVHREKGQTFPEYKAVSLMERDEPIPDEILEMLNDFIEKSEENKWKHPLEMVLHFPSYDEVKESMLTEVSESEEEETDTGGDKREKKFGKKPLGKKGKEKEGPSEEEFLEKLQELKDALEGMNKFKFKKWCKENDFEEFADEDQEEAISAITDKYYSDFIDGAFKDDDIPF